MSSETLRVGLAGAGVMGAMHGSAYAALRGVQVVAVASARRAQAEKVAEPFGATLYEDWRALLENEQLDILDVCLPTDQHAEATVAALERGLHVLCEKPMALSVQEADTMLEAARAHQRILMIGHVLRFWPEYMALDDLRSAGTFGELRSFTARRVGALPLWTWDNWIQQSDRSGGAALDLHIHDLDFILHLFGLPRAVFAQGRGDVPGARHIQTAFIYDDGTLAAAEGAWHPAPSCPFEMSFSAGFEGGVLQMSPHRQQPFWAAPTDGEGFVPPLPETQARLLDTGGNINTAIPYLNEVDYFVDCVRHNRPPERCPAEESRDAVRVTRAALESCRRGTPVEITP